MFSNRNTKDFHEKSALVLSQMKKKKKKQNRRAIWVKDQLKRKEEKAVYNTISDRQEFY